MLGSLAKFRRARGWKSAEDFARELGIPANTWKRYESNPNNMPIRYAWGAAELLNVTIDEVVGRSDMPTRDHADDVADGYRKLPPHERVMLDEYLDYLQYHAARGTKQDEVMRDHIAKLEAERWFDLWEECERRGIEDGEDEVSRDGHFAAELTLRLQRERETDAMRVSRHIAIEQGVDPEHLEDEAQSIARERMPEAFFVSDEIIDDANDIADACRDLDRARKADITVFKG